MLTTILDGWVGGWVGGWPGGWPGGWGALEEWTLRLTSAKVEVEVEAELGKTIYVSFLIKAVLISYYSL